MRIDRSCVPMIRMPSARVIIAVGVIATALAMPCRAADKLPAYSKLVHRKLGGGCTLALEAARRDKTFFLCLPGKTDCISTATIGWKKPFIITGTSSLGYNVYDTSTKKSGDAPNLSAVRRDLKDTPIYSAAAVWEKLSATKPVW